MIKPQLPFKSKVVTANIPWPDEPKNLLWFDEAPKPRPPQLTREEAITSAENVYMRLDGTIAPKKFDIPGLWTFDGQIFIPPKKVPHG